MLLVTTPRVEGKSVRRYLGVIGAEVILGANVLRDLYALFTDVFGGRSAKFEGVFDKARKQALDALASKAGMLGADAVLNLRFYYLVLGKDNGMMMVAVSGTAVQLTASIGEEKADDEIDDLNGPTYFVEIEGRKLGPFSKWQIRELHTAGRIGTETEIQAGADGKILKVGEVLNGI
jgi:uncharacterized protein YbjQ (UPF0145 family)